MMEDEMEFSLSHVWTCSGNGRGGLPYVRFFCREAVIRVQAAADKLAKIANLETWGDNVEAEVDSHMIYVQAIAHSINLARSFFALKSQMAEPFEDAATKVEKIRSTAAGHYYEIHRWIEAARRPLDQ